MSEYEKNKKKIQQLCSLSRTKTFYLSVDCITRLEVLAERYSEEVGFTITKGRIIELAVNYITPYSFKELLPH